MSSRRTERRLWVVAALLAVLAATAVGCASSSAIALGRDAERNGDYDRAVVELTRAVREHPRDARLKSDLQRVRLRASEEHVTRGRRLSSTGKLEEALVELQLASELNPGNGDVDDLLRTTRTRLRNKVAVTREGKTQLETLIDQTRSMAPPGLDLPRDVKLPDALVFRDASARDVLTALARFANINVIFDPAYRDATLSIDLRQTGLEEALSAVTTSTRNFYRVTAARTVTIVPDTAAKRREYEEEIIRTFYLSNADLKESLDLLRIVVDNRRLSPITATNAITIKDTPERIAAAARVLNAIDKARAEVVIDVELIEVDRSRLNEYGVRVASPGADGIDGSVDVNRDELTLSDIRKLTQSDVFLANLPGLYYKLIKTDALTRTLANPQLRTSEGLAAQARFGERVPVPVTTFAPIATGGVNQQPITSFNYENIGVNIDITPRIHHDDDVSLALKIEVSSISGTGYGGLPTFGNRSIATTIRLKDGETNMLAGLIRDEERRTIRGIPGLSDIPVLGRLFANNRAETVETDIILVLTPHIVRVLDLTESDLRPFRVGRVDGSGTPADLPSAPAPPEQFDPQVPASQNPATQPAPGVPGAVTPARPPVKPPPQQ